MRYQVEHETALMRAIRRNNEFAVDELIAASAKQSCLDYENKVRSFGEFVVEMLSYAMWHVWGDWSEYLIKNTYIYTYMHKYLRAYVHTHK